MTEIANNTGELKERTKKFALRVLKLVSRLPKNLPSSVMGKQLVRSATSVGANYRSACRGRSRNEFASKLGIVLEEADETAYWLELIIESGSMPESKCGPLLTEAKELTAIFTTALTTLRAAAPPQPKRPLRKP